ncbi:hypothetical protein F2P81_024428 [Scophthalmus maximus]|uniref:Uncharacterized protein n=1 Tax=Scophthalmus maximus TaxID=52904 RepID=A0A6A4RUU3_SCOMX|nr:hypothetical protein F2P81_024428 [Scophthalmus maximus]
MIVIVYDRWRKFKCETNQRENKAGKGTLNTIISVVHHVPHMQYLLAPTIASKPFAEPSSASHELDQVPKL